MAIDRKKLVEHHNPKLKDVDTTSPLTVGNGEFAFTADVTGLQSLYNAYREDCPLCTMSQWGWHTKPVSEERYAWTLADYKMQEFHTGAGRYPTREGPRPVMRKCMTGSGKIHIG